MIGLLLGQLGNPKLLFGYPNDSDPYENTLDPLYSLSLPPGSVPMISIIQTHSQKLGPPYSKCVKQNALTFYEQYTQDQCIFEVLPINVRVMYLGHNF